MCENQQNCCDGAKQSPAEFQRLATRYSIDAPSLLTVVEPRDGQPLELHLVPDNTRRQSQDFVDELENNNRHLKSLVETASEAFNKETAKQKTHIADLEKMLHDAVEEWQGKCSRQRDTLEQMNAYNERCTKTIKSAAPDIFRAECLDTLVTDIVGRFKEQRITIHNLFNQRDELHKKAQALEGAQLEKCALEDKLKEIFRELAQSKAHAERGWDRVATRGRQLIAEEEKAKVYESRLKALKARVTEAHDLLTRAGVPLGGTLIVRLARAFDENNPMNAYASSVKACHDFLDSMGVPKDGSVLVRFKRMLALQGQCGCTTCEAATKDNEIARLNTEKKSLETRLEETHKFAHHCRLEATTATTELASLKATLSSTKEHADRGWNRVRELENQLADIRESAKVL